MKSSLRLLILTAVVLIGCKQVEADVRGSTPIATAKIVETATEIAVPSATIEASVTEGEIESTSAPVAQPAIAPIRLAYPEDWRDMPVIPEISGRTREIYQRGMELGRDPHSFSIIGDCQSVDVYFLGDFANPENYRLGEYEELQAVIDQFQGSFDRRRLAVMGGYDVASVLSPFWADPEICERHESPLECEIRVGNPSMVIISMETWWYDRPIETYAGYMRQIVEYAIDSGVVPILATKADNREGYDQINQAVVAIAQEYEVPLWNWWAAAQPLPGHGMMDIFHLSVEEPMYDDPNVFYYGWPVRNLTALQTLDAVWRGVKD